MSGAKSEIVTLLFMFVVIIFSGAVIKYTVPGLGEIIIPHQKEGLENMQSQNFKLTPGGYPVTHDMLLLNPEYPKASNEATSSTSSTSSYESTVGSTSGAGPGPAWQFSTPDNGTCSPMIFCNTFYGKRPLGENGSSEYKIPEAIPFSDNRRRVNFYAADDNNN
jgi:hypothetical protein